MRHPLPDPHWPTREQAAASRLFQPIRIGGWESTTRTWVPAMVPWRATDDGFVTPEVIDWYGRFADGQPGVLVVEATGIRDVQSGPLLRIGHDRFLPGLRDLVAEVRQRSQGKTRLLIQLIDFLSIRRRPEPGKYFERFLQVTPRHHKAMAQATGEHAWLQADDASLRQALAQAPDEVQRAVLSPREWEALQFGARERVWDLDNPDIEALPRTLPQRFAEAARRARDAGFDGVELHYAHAYTMASFLSRLNDRPDGYGGSLGSRVRLPLEVFQAVRQAVGNDYTVGCRFLGDEVIPGGSRLEDACYYAERFAGAGMDFLSVSKGGKFEDARQPKVGEAAYPYTGPSGQECMPTVRMEGSPFGRNLPLAHAIRGRVRASGFDTPVVGAGGIATFEHAEAALQQGDCDLVASARQSLADPDWWLKMQLGQGDSIRRCIFTNYCEGLDQKHKQVTCQLWDRDLESPDASPQGEKRALSLAHDGKRRLLAPPSPAFL
ncbi:MAG: NADH:flavin oxidoreductase [Planctomycetes bacterium]|nr:NADH:flavin oxidoreductase [Planctomycetota bacterium]MCB9909701.1 NADH:flavin oxidoreductase [Planctomycetota bacterium]MCB9911810.1 NADH:flavin oxidoreductase [Planctomycetota bacterium]